MNNTSKRITFVADDWDGDKTCLEIIYKGKSLSILIDEDGIELIGQMEITATQTKCNQIKIK